MENLKASLTPYDISFPIKGTRIQKPVVKAAEPPKEIKPVKRKKKEKEIVINTNDPTLRSALLAKSIYKRMF